MKENTVKLIGSITLCVYLLGLIIFAGHSIANSKANDAITRGMEGFFSGVFWPIYASALYFENKNELKNK